MQYFLTPLMVLYTSKILLPSMRTPSIPYPFARSTKCSHLYCSLVGVLKPYPLFSIIKITGKPHTAATFKAS